MSAKKLIGQDNSLYKILFVGDKYVGKRNILHKFQMVGSLDTYEPDEIDFAFKTVTVEGSKIKMRMWDTQSMDKDQILRSYKTSQGIYLVYDVRSADSFSNLSVYIEDIKKRAIPNISIILLGNNADDAIDRQVPTKQGLELAERHGFKFFEISTSTDKNVLPSLYAMAEDIKHKLQKSQVPEKEPLREQPAKTGDKIKGFFGDMMKRTGPKKPKKLLNKLQPKTETALKSKLVFSTNSDITGIPEEILRMDSRSLEIFRNALKSGTFKSYHLRIMFVGHYAVGKSTLAMALLNKNPVFLKITSTNGIEIFNGRCFYNRKTKEWVIQEAGITDFSAPEILARDIFENITLNKPDFEQPGAFGYDENDGNTDKVEPKLPNNNTDISLRKSTTRSEDENKDLKKVKETPLMMQFKEMSTNILLQKVIDEKKKTKSEMDEFLVPVDIWDFGGQTVFYTTHQTFLTYRSIYILTYDASRDLDDKVDDQSLDEGGKEKSSVIAYLRFWISSIITYTEGNTRGFPKIILVGTHWDLIPESQRQQRKQEIRNVISRHFKEELSQQLVFNENIFLNATDPQDDGYTKLRDEIIHQAETQPHWGEELPKSWLPLYDNIFDLKRKGRMVIPIEVVKTINSHSVTPLDDNELNVLLKFLHSLGHILYFDVTELNMFVILHPQWLIDALKSLITADLFCKDDKEKYSAWQNMSKQGILTKDTIYNLWSREGTHLFALHRVHLMNTMEKLDLVVKPVVYDQNGNVSTANFFYVPCMLKESFPEEKRPIIKAMLDDGITIQCVFQKNLLPLAVYNRLVAACLGSWPILDDHLYFGLCLFQLDPFHILAVQKHGHTINIIIAHKRGKTNVSRRLCRGVEDTITSMLKKIIMVYKSKWLLSLGGEEVDVEESPFSVKRMYDIQDSEETVECECSDDCEGLPPNAMDSSPTDLELSRLSAYLLPDQLYPVAVELGTSSFELERFRHDYCSIQDVFFSILQAWRKRASGHQCKIRTLVKTFRDLGINEHIFCKIYRILDKAEIDPIDLPIVKRKEIPSDKILDEIAVHINEKFLHVAIEIGVKCDELKLLQMKHNLDPLKMIREMLHLWKEKSSVTPTVEVLALAMRVVGCDYKSLCDLVK